MELLRMMNRKAVPSKAIVAGLAKELDSDQRSLENWLRRSGKTWGRS
jgi:hypothetical protein